MQFKKLRTKCVEKEEGGGGEAGGGAGDSEEEAAKAANRGSVHGTVAAFACVGKKDDNMLLMDLTCKLSSSSTAATTRNGQWIQPWEVGGGRWEVGGGRIEHRLSRMLAVSWLGG